MSDPFFNYIITIHNKEALIREVLVSTLLCCGPNSTIYAVLDGCTDGTEAILDEFAARYNGVPLVKVYAPDVHEILSINAGLKAASQRVGGYNIILQDDVVLADLDLEAKIVQLYEWAGPQLGIVSFRMGGNLVPNALQDEAFPATLDLIENAYGHGIPDAQILFPGRFAYRTVPIKSPICIPTRLISELGLMNEDLAPYMHDDTDFAIRAVTAGYMNGVFGVRFYSDVKWGGTRTKPHPDLKKMAERNMGRIRSRYPKEIRKILESPQQGDLLEVPGMCSEEQDLHAKAQHELAKNNFPEPSLQTKLLTQLRRLKITS